MFVVVGLLSLTVESERDPACVYNHKSVIARGQQANWSIRSILDYLNFNIRILYSTTKKYCFKILIVWCWSDRSLMLTVAPNPTSNDCVGKIWQLIKAHLGEGGQVHCKDGRFGHRILHASIGYVVDTIYIFRHES